MDYTFWQAAGMPDVFLHCNRYSESLRHFQKVELEYLAALFNRLEDTDDPALRFQLIAQASAVAGNSNTLQAQAARVRLELLKRDGLSTQVNKED